MVHEILARSNAFTSCIFSHEFRTSNVEDHNLAKLALSFGAGRYAWLGQPGDLLFVPVNTATN